MKFYKGKLGKDLVICFVELSCAGIRLQILERQRDDTALSRTLLRKISVPI